MTASPASHSVCSAQFDTDSVRSLLHELIDYASHNGSPLSPSSGEGEVSEQAKAYAAHIKGLDQFLKTGAGLLKFIDALDAHNKSKQSEESEKAHTRYEDLPPLNDEDRAAMHKRLNTLAREVSLQNGLGEFCFTAESE